MKTQEEAALLEALEGKEDELAERLATWYPSELRTLREALNMLLEWVNDEIYRRDYTGD